MTSFLKLTKNKIVATILLIILYISKSYLMLIFVTNHFRNNLEPAAWFLPVSWSINTVFYILTGSILVYYFKKSLFSIHKLKEVVLISLIIFLGISMTGAIPRLFFQFLTLFISIEKLTGLLPFLIFIILNIILLYATVCVIYYVSFNKLTDKKSNTKPQ